MERGWQYGRDLYEDRLIRRIDALSPLVVLTFACRSSGLSRRRPELDHRRRGTRVGPLVRVFTYQHATFSVNSICHMFGRRAYAHGTRAVTTGGRDADEGEGWHNNHHAFPTRRDNGSTGSSWTRPGGRFAPLGRVGLAWDVKLPTRLSSRADGSHRGPESASSPRATPSTQARQRGHAQAR